MRAEDARSVRIDGLGLSTRASNILLGAKYYKAPPGEIKDAETVGDVLNHLVEVDGTIAHLRGCGRVTIKEIVRALAAAGIPQGIIDGLLPSHMRGLFVESVAKQSEQAPELIAFFYLLVRDALPAGEVKRIVKEARKSRGKDLVLSSPALGDLARELAVELLT